MDTQLFHKAALIPLIPRLCKIHSISRHLQASHAKLFTTTDQFNWTLESTGTYIVSLWLAFLTSVQQGRALEYMLCIIQQHGYALPNLPEIYLCIIQQHGYALPNLPEIYLCIIQQHGYALPNLPEIYLKPLKYDASLLRTHSSGTYIWCPH